MNECGHFYSEGQASPAMIRVVEICYELGCWLEENEHPPECLDGEPGGMVEEQAQPARPDPSVILPCAGMEALSNEPDTNLSIEPNDTTNMEKMK